MFEQCCNDLVGSLLLRAMVSLTSLSPFPGREANASVRPGM